MISDFGFGARRKTREDFVNSFEMVYFLKRMRMLGEDVRILRRYPGNWQVVPTLIRLSSRLTYYMSSGYM